MARNGSLWRVPEELKPYLAYSFGLHAALAVLALKILSGAPAPSGAVYTIDFVGPTATLLNTGSAGALPKQELAPEPAAVKPPPQVEFDEFGRRRRKRRFLLPRPSLLKGLREKAPKEEAVSKGEAQPVPASEPASGGGAGAGVATDMPNFPYPWYISQVRQALWNLWSSRMPKEAGECVVVFSILPAGGIVDLRTESSSGDSAFDLTALGAAQDAAPFPPLPRGFAEPFLKIHVTLKSS